MARCERIDTEEGVAFVRFGSRRRPVEQSQAPVCVWCMKKAVKFCDFPVPRSRPSRDQLRRGIRHIRGITTCSLPMCEDHADHRGADIDLCPQHKNERLAL